MLPAHAAASGCGAPHHPHRAARLGICMATFQLNAAPEDTGDIPCAHPCLQQPPGVYQAPLQNLGMMDCSQTFPGK